MEKSNRLISTIRILNQALHQYRGQDRCLVPPSPALQARINRELAELRNSASSYLANTLRSRPATPPGLNDGLIYPGPTFPLDASVSSIRRAAEARDPFRGEVRVIVVLVEFPDEAMGRSRQDFEDLFFSRGVLPNGSVKEYFLEVSNNLVEVVGEVVGPYTLPNNLSEYANGASGMNRYGMNARVMARHAAEAADPDVDFEIYDNDGDDYVDAFVVIHAGPGAELTGDGNDIWSHKWVLNSGAYEADGAKVYGYLTVPEDSKIGVCCHELGHLLFGFPDLYDIDDSSEGVGNWCLMGSGSWLGNDGDVPGHPSAWCKVQQKWVAIENLTKNATLSLEDVKTGFKVLRLWKDGSPGNEYYLIENRQKTRFDQFLPGNGLLVWHVDDLIQTNSDESHPKVALVQADGRKDLELGNNRGDTGDPFPGSTNKLNFNGDSTPNSNSYSSRETCVALMAISAPGPMMTMKVDVKCEEDSGKKSIWQLILEWLSRFSD